MASEEHLDLINQGAATWNDWRQRNPGLVPDLEAVAFGLSQKQWGPEYGGPINLAGARLRNSDLRFATLIGSILEGADLSGAKLFDARLCDANLRNADLSDARLDDADVSDAQFEGALLFGTDLSSVRNLTSDQIASAEVDDTTLLPPNVKRPRNEEVKAPAPEPKKVESNKSAKADKAKAARTEIKKTKPAKAKDTGPEQPKTVSGASAQPEKIAAPPVHKAKASVELPTGERRLPQPLPIAIVLAAGLALGLAYWMLAGASTGDVSPGSPSNEIASRSDPAPEKPLPQRPQRPGASQLSPDAAAWSRAAAAGTREALQSYLGDHPNGKHVAEAEAKLEELLMVAARAEAIHQRNADNAAWGRANADGTPEAWESYLADFPEGQHAGEARQRLAMFGAKVLFRPIPDRPPVSTPKAAPIASPKKPPAANRSRSRQATTVRRAPQARRGSIQASDVLSGGL